MQWNRKLTIGAATLAATGLLLAGCSAPGTESGGGATDDGTFLKIDWLANEKAGIDAVVAAFQEANPDIQVVVTTADTAQYQASIRTQLGTGTAADVFYVWPGDGNTAAIRQLDGGDFMTDLSDQDWVSAYPDFIRELVSIDSAAYIMAPLATAFAPSTTRRRSTRRGSPLRPRGVTSSRSARPPRPPARSPTRSPATTSTPARRRTTRSSPTSSTARAPSSTRSCSTARRPSPTTRATWRRPRSTST